MLVSVIMTIGQYALCALVAPETPPTGEIDLRGFHNREHRRYAAALLALCVLAVVQNLMLMSAYANWIRDSISSFELAAIGVLALVVRRGRVQLCAAAALALSTTWFMILSCAITPR
ncbi:hypothetical protein [Sphingomonas sp.]|uniref:hypothetical protein n=1 Tax=Sphingomonas sp. TaxID=28214 RepID=UPI003CC52378